MTTQEKASILFEYLLKFSANLKKVVRDYDKYEFVRAFKDLPTYKDYIKTYADFEDEEAQDYCILSIAKPDIKPCPEPDSIFVEWIVGDYTNISVDVEYEEKKDKYINGEASTEYFEDYTPRYTSYKRWYEEREKWRSTNTKKKDILALFSQMYKLYLDIKSNSETKELVIANGIFTVRNASLETKQDYICHPVITQKVTLKFNLVDNVISIVSTDEETQVVSELFQQIDGINLEAIKTLTADIENSNCNPISDDGLDTIFTVFMNQLSPSAKYVKSKDDIESNISDVYFLYKEPMLIYKNRTDGTQKAIEKIIENIDNVGMVPASICDLVDAGVNEIPEEMEDLTLEEQLASVGGESKDILLSKEANSEQLEIAKRIENYNGVIVQGPPGTGKTHTIANLLGHFLSQGKSVLVTSHTNKALNVLKDKLVPEMQSLCVSLTDENNKDMLKSVDGISEYISRHNSSELQNKIRAIEKTRINKIQELADIRKKIYASLYKESAQIVINGDEISPIDAAKYVHNNETLSYIPGRVELFKPLPLTYMELVELYNSNGRIDTEEEAELGTDIPSPSLFLMPDTIREAIDEIIETRNVINSAVNNSTWIKELDINNKDVVISTSDGKTYKIDRYKAEYILQIEEYLGTFSYSIQPWQYETIIAGKKGGSYEKNWRILIEQIKKTLEFQEIQNASIFGNDVEFYDYSLAMSHIDTYQKIYDLYERKGKISRFDLIKDREIEQALSNASVNGYEPSSQKDVRVVLDTLQLYWEQDLCCRYWDRLVGSAGGPSFSQLDSRDPVNAASKNIKAIERLLEWYKKEYPMILERLRYSTIPVSIIDSTAPGMTDEAEIYEIFSSIKNSLLELVRILSYVDKLNQYDDKLKEATKDLVPYTHIKYCTYMVEALKECNSDKYRINYEGLRTLYNKRDVSAMRSDLLNKLESSAPEWAKAIENRVGLHGETTVPENIEDAWKWKQYYCILSEMYGESIEDLQSRAMVLSREYRNITAELATTKAWCSLIERIQKNTYINQALRGWALTMKKGGKFKGKHAAELKAQARELMKVCQKAVPAWIMPVAKALETLDPRTNHFDIVIVDEASQSDISALAVTYLAEKVIIVGDDKQVSPMAVGVDADKIQSLLAMTIKDAIPNWFLYTEKTSLYDIAMTTFRPLMLKEHFRCVPDIIGYSNKYYYDYKIKPLRDASSSKLLPAVVNFRTENGARGDGKTNVIEARNVVALIMACMNQPEYNEKSFGVISMLGDEQAKLIQNMLLEKIGISEYEKRNIMCGNSATFQGDERDVIFLSLVDSSENVEKPLRRVGEGADGAYSKRYNVATSRARDQLWVVHSLDASNQLQSGDLRRELIEYATDPKAFAIQEEEILKLADSPFEVEVANMLVSRGYHIKQQWEVGAYRIDMVALYGNKKIAIECDGEAFHSGEEKIRQDMERQTILERIGWNFIRIRGSEFYRDKEKTIERVVEQLTKYGIEKEDAVTIEEHTDTELLSRVKIRAQEILEKWNISYLDQSVVEYALKQPNPAEEDSHPVSDTSNIRIHSSVVSIIDIINEHNLQYIDNRSTNGKLWVVGDYGIKDFIEEAETYGYTFIFKENGTIATGLHDAWYLKD